MGKRQDHELMAIRLYADGMEIPEISQKSKEEGWYVSENTLRKWRDRAGTEWQDARKAARASTLVNMEDVGSRIRRSREIASQIMGDAKDQSALGLVLIQTLQTMLFDLMGQINTVSVDPDELGGLTKMVTNLTLALGRTEQSMSRNQQNAAEIRKQTTEKAAEIAGDTAKQAGVSAETIAIIRRDILRMAE
ncbi:MAG: DUF3486 family protein [Geobacteraceae bacterium]|nr:DUF3486 family protein [Geobacteraceae bacterium]